LRYHAGAWGYRSYLMYDEKTGITVSVLSNLQGKSVTSIAEKLLEIALQQRPQKNIDTRLVSIISPIGNACKADSITFFLQNNGLSTTDLLQIHAEIDGNTVFDNQLTLNNFFSNQTRKIKIPINFIGNLEGLHELLLSVTVPGIIAQGYLEDDTKIISFYGHQNAGANPNLLSLETFDHANGALPIGWTSHQTADVQDWSTSHFAGNGGALCRQNQNDGNENVVFRLDLPSINTISLTNASSFGFDYAYALYAGYPNTDSLEVLISTDCGQNFTSIWKKGGTDLTTANPIAASFLPKVNDWETVNIPLNINQLGNENTVFRFSMWNGYGNNLWLDNVGLKAVTSLKTPKETAFEIAPNPMRTSTQISFKEEMKDVNVSIFDIFGRKVHETLGFSGLTMKIERKSLAAGVYVAKLEKNGKSAFLGKIEIID
jgi:Secretion system C-terminal sorting domain